MDRRGAPASGMDGAHGVDPRPAPDAFATRDDAAFHDPDASEEVVRRDGSRRARIRWRLLACGALGFLGTYGALLLIGMFGVPALLAFLVLGLGGALVEPRRSGFALMTTGSFACFVLLTAAYLVGRPAADTQYDTLAPVVLIVGTALAAFLMGAGYMLRRLLADSSTDPRPIDG